MTIVRLVRNIDMKAELKKGSEEWEMFQDYWKLCKEVWLPEENDEYWKMVADQAEEFHKKYKTSFSKYGSAYQRMMEAAMQGGYCYA